MSVCAVIFEADLRGASGPGNDLSTRRDHSLSPASRRVAGERARATPSTSVVCAQPPMPPATATGVNSPARAPAASAVSEELRNVLWWHCGWALALTVAAVVVSVVAPWSNGAPGLALIVGAAPAIAAIVALRWETEGSRIGLLAVWALAGAVAAGLTGGLTGPLAPWCLAPLAAAILLGARRISWGAVLSVLALASVALAQAAGLTQPPPTGVLAGGLPLVG